jgi:hypothetical protein
MLHLEFTPTHNKKSKDTKKELSMLRNVRVTKNNKGVVCDWDPHNIYASCEKCFFVKPVVARECARAIPDIKNWKCEDCASHSTPSVLDSATDYNQNTKNCPSCSFATEKNGGCNHITCICNTHWCWSCGQNSDDDNGVFNSGNIYDHMANCQGIFSDDY